jgi:hypothetical protein
MIWVTMLMLSFALNCNETLMINNTNEFWTDNDIKCYNRAKIRCGEYYKYSPCLKSFTKVEYQTYRAICSKEK